MTGLGWKSIVSVHAGAQYYYSERLSLRLGYQYNPSPIGTDQAFFNVASPLIIEHVLGIGLSYRLTEHEIVSLAYLHGFQNESTGPIYSPGRGAHSRHLGDQRRFRRRAGRWPDRTVLNSAAPGVPALAGRGACSSGFSRRLQRPTG